MFRTGDKLYSLNHHADSLLPPAIMMSFDRLRIHKPHKTGLDLTSPEEKSAHQNPQKTLTPHQNRKKIPAP